MTDKKPTQEHPSPTLPFASGETEGAKSGASPRVAAARILDAVLHRGRSLKTELAQALPSLSDPRDRALVEAICFAALRRRARYDAAIAAWIPKPLPKRDSALRALLYVGFAQLDALELAPHAAVAATVDAARVLGRAHQAGLVNALLRRAQREGFPQVDADAQWPSWLRERLRNDWHDEADAIIASSAQPGPLWLRVNRRRGTRAAYRLRLHEAGIEAIEAEHLADALRIDAPVAVAELPGFAEGDVSIQDGAAQSVADALAPAQGARVLDACAAPGGKAAHLLERDPTLRLTALEIDATRLARVRETFARLHLWEGLQPRQEVVGAEAPPTETVLPTIKLQTADAIDVAAWWDGIPFDAILLDAPCSATGIVRRQPDVLLHRRASDIDALVALQTRLLDVLWQVLRPGGTLLYATCSILKNENERVVDAFLARTPDAAAEPLDARYGRVAGPGRQRLPGEDGMDGFFYARMRKCPPG